MRISVHPSIVILLLVSLSSGSKANLLANPGFEEGLNNWLVSGTVNARSSDPLAYEGSSYIVGSDGPQFIISQDIDLLSEGVFAEDIDAGIMGLEFGGWQSGYDSKDTGQIFIYLFDVNMTQIGGAQLDSFTSSRMWQQKSGTIDLPINTRYVRFEFIGTLNFGTNIDAYLDAAYLDAVNIELPPLNFLSNPGFEAGLDYWQLDGSAAIRSSDPQAFEGIYYIFGQDGPQFNVWQDVDLHILGLSAADIEAGNTRLEFGGWQSGYSSQDTGQIFIYLFDADMVQVGETALSSFTSSQLWEQQSGSIILPGNTRFVRYEFVGTAAFGSNTDAYLDATYLSVSADPAHIRGDINNDGIINITDALLLEKHLLGLSTLDPSALLRADLYPQNSADGAITMADFLLLQRLLIQ